MDEKKEFKLELSKVGLKEIAFVLWIIAFWGEPDIVDAIIYFLMK